MSNITAEYVILGLAAVALLSAFGIFIIAPAWISYGRYWEKLVASFLSIYILAALICIGVGLGLLVVYYWDTISSIF